MINNKYVFTPISEGNTKEMGFHFHRLLDTTYQQRKQQGKDSEPSDTKFN